MDVDAYVAAHQHEWRRLDQLVGAGSRLTGAQADELVELYQRTATHLSVVRSASPDPALVGRLSNLVTRARGALTGSKGGGLRDAGRFFTVAFPAALYRSARWWGTTAFVALLVGGVIAAWVAGNDDVQATIGTAEEIRQLVEVDFEDYYSADPAGSFAARVWTNNAWVAALCLATAVPSLGLFVVWILFQNSMNVGIAAGLMAANDRLSLFFGLILPHGLLELTAVFIAAGAGLRLAWCVIDPGPRTRTAALAQEGRSAASLVIGLVVVLFVSGILEAFVTPSGLPTWARIGIGVAVEAAFLTYVVVLGRRAVRAGETGDIAPDQREALAPSAA